MSATPFTDAVLERWPVTAANPMTTMDDQRAALIAACRKLECEKAKVVHYAEQLEVAAKGVLLTHGHYRAAIDELRAALSIPLAAQSTERSASAQPDREAGSTCTPGVATRVQGSADFQRTPHGSEGSASPLHPTSPLGVDHQFREVAIHDGTGVMYGPFRNNAEANAWVDRVDAKGTWSFEDIHPPFEPKSVPVEYHSEKKT